jgi:hypothetical protein
MRKTSLKSCYCFSDIFLKENNLIKYDNGGKRIKIDLTDAVVKIISIVLVVIFSAIMIWSYFVFTSVEFVLGQVMAGALILSIIFTFSWIFFFFAFYQDLRKIFFRVRTHYGEWITLRKKLDEKFREAGGIVGYHPYLKDHIAIIYPSDSENNYPKLKKDGILPLIEHYKNIKQNYKLYYCYLTEDFLRLIKSQNTKGIHIFGHGRIDSLLFKDGIVQYRELKNAPVKEFVAQWHCNHGDGGSLGKYIGKKYYAPPGKRNAWQNRKDIERLIKSELEWIIHKNLPNSISILYPTLKVYDKDHNCIYSSNC